MKIRIINHFNTKYIVLWKRKWKGPFGNETLYRRKTIYIKILPFFLDDRCKERSTISFFFQLITSTLKHKSLTNFCYLSVFYFGTITIRTLLKYANTKIALPTMLTRPTGLSVGWKLASSKWWNTSVTTSHFQNDICTETAFPIFNFSSHSIELIFEWRTNEVQAENCTNVSR